MFTIPPAPAEPTAFRAHLLALAGALLQLREPLEGPELRPASLVRPLVRAELELTADTLEAWAAELPARASRGIYS